jgi:hypothetical protein
MKRRTVHRPLEPGVASHDRHREAFIDGFLLTTPYPALRATFSASRKRGDALAARDSSPSARRRWPLRALAPERAGETSSMKPDTRRSPRGVQEQM